MPYSDCITDVLRKAPAFGALPDELLTELAPSVREVIVHPGEVIAREGSSPHLAFLVLNGAGDAFVDGEWTATVTRGAFIGETAMRKGGTHVATVRAKTLMRLLEIGPHALATLAAQPAAREPTAVD